jgi:FtsZ-interacting cell division protein ZipA
VVERTGHRVRRRRGGSCDSRAPAGAIGPAAPAPGAARARAARLGVSPLEPLSIKTADFDRVPMDMPMMALDIDSIFEEIIDGSPDPKQRREAPSPGADSGAQAGAAQHRPERAQKIVTLRVCALGQTRWPGRDSCSALERKGLAYGRYQVYHRNHADGNSLFCVASLVEPGSFDPEQMAEQEFRGISLFAVLPGPQEPLQTLDALLATAKGLAEELEGHGPGCAKGVPLSPQRIAALREEVARFQAQLADKRCRERQASPGKAAARVGAEAARVDRALQLPLSRARRSPRCRTPNTTG